MPRGAGGARYRRPLLIAETGSSDDDRPPWLRYVAEETRAAMAAGVPVGGICLYPILNFPRWGNGLRDSPPDAAGERAVYQPPADELRRPQGLFARA